MNKKLEIGVNKPRFEGWDSVSLPEFNIENRKKIQPIPGNVPNMNNLPSGCNFNPRCYLVKESCKIQKPDLAKISESRKSRCFEYKQLI